MTDQYKEFIPWIIGVLSTIFALKKDFIKSKFNKEHEKIIISSISEDNESKSLDNVEKTMSIYRSMVDDLRENIQDLKDEIKTLKKFIKEQKDFINEQSEEIKRFRKKNQ